MTLEHSRTESNKQTESAQSIVGLAVAQGMLAPLVSERVLPGLNQRLLSPATRTGARSSPVQAHITELCGHLIDIDLSAAWRLCERWRAQGGSVDDLVMRVLCGSVHRLGQLWTDDEIDFATCTAAMTTSSALLRRIEADMRGRQAYSRLRSRLLMLPVPGEAHSFGTQIAAFYLRRRGFEVRTGIVASPDEILFLAAQSPVDAIGLSISGEGRLEMLAESLAVLRSDAATAGLPVFAGGSLVQVSPARIRRLNFDLILADIASAPTALTRLLAPEAVSAPTL